LPLCILPHNYAVQNTLFTQTLFLTNGFFLFYKYKLLALYAILYTFYNTELHLKWKGLRVPNNSIDNAFSTASICTERHTFCINYNAILMKLNMLKTTNYFGYIPYSNLVNFNDKYFQIRRIQTPTCIPFSKDRSNSSWFKQ